MEIRNLVPWGAARRRGVAVRGEEGPVQTLRGQMDALFDNFFRSFERDFPAGVFGERLSGFVPSMDVTETPKEVVVTAELPGMDEKDIEVTLSEDSLTLKGRKKEEKEEKGGDFYRMERSFGSFQRTVALPVGVRAQEARATFGKGVLTVKLPKVEEAAKEKKKIEVKAE